MNPQSFGTLVSIHRSPVKLIIGEELNASRVGSKGLHNDRLLALADPASVLQGGIIRRCDPEKIAPA